MSKINSKKLHYATDNIGLTVNSNSSTRLNSIDSYLSLPQVEDLPAYQQRAELTCCDMDAFAAKIKELTLHS